MLKDQYGNTHTISSALVNLQAKYTLPESIHEFSNEVFSLITPDPEQKTSAEFTQSHWILRESNMIKVITHHCVPCRRMTQAPIKQQMVDSPKDRIKRGTYPFLSGGCDFSGPLHAKWGRERDKG